LAEDRKRSLCRTQRRDGDELAVVSRVQRLLIHYTHLMSYRCAIREVRIGIDTTVPNQVLKMPPCDMKDPSAIPYDAKPYLKLSPSNQFVSVELTYRDGSVSEIRSFRR
jgi:hypothetical protein